MPCAQVLSATPVAASRSPADTASVVAGHVDDVDQFLQRGRDKKRDEELEAAAKTIPNAKPYPCDITDDAALRACLGAIARALGPIDDVIYNAGNGVWKKFDEISVDQLDAAMKTNVYGLLSTCQVATPAMIKRGSGNVIVTGATASLRGMPFTSAFASAKAAQAALWGM